MLFKTVVVTLLASFAVAQSGTCFDDGDCLLSGGKCQKSGLAIVGSCSGSSGSGTGTGAGLGGFSFPTNFALPSFGKREAEAEAEQ